MGKKKEQIEAPDMEYTKDVTSKKDVKEKKEVEFEYLAISKEDFEEFTEGIESLNKHTQMFIGNLLMNKFRMIPKSITEVKEDKDK